MSINTKAFKLTVSKRGWNWVACYRTNGGELVAAGVASSYDRAVSLATDDLKGVMIESLSSFMDAFDNDARIIHA
jgi:hypothetical protein